MEPIVLPPVIVTASRLDGFIWEFTWQSYLREWNGSAWTFELIEASVKIYPDTSYTKTVANFPTSANSTVNVEYNGPGPNGYKTVTATQTNADGTTQSVTLIDCSGMFWYKWDDNWWSIDPNSNFGPGQWVMQGPTLPPPDPQ